MAKIVEPELLKADKDLEFDKGSNITLNNLKDQEETRLYNLGLIWGFLKYYHPAVAAGEYNWDYELFRILPELADLKGEEWDARLQSWINNLGELKEGKEPEYNDEVKIYPDLDWIENSGFSSDLVVALQKVKTAKRTGEHYYIELAKGVQNPVFLNENRYKDMPSPDAGFRLLALYKYWNMIQYFFPYKHLIEGDWKAVLAESVPKFIEADNELAYKLNMLELIGKIHDTHANIWGADSTLTAFKGERYTPISIRFIEDKAVVTGFYNEELAKETGLKIGDIITAVDGKPVDDLVKEKLKYYPASNYVTKLRGISRDLLRSNTETIAVEYTSGQNAKSATLKTYLPEKLDLRLTDAKPDTCFSYLEPDIAYIYPGNIDAKHISDFMEEIQDTKGLVIDLRCYPSNFIVFTLGRHLMPEKTEFVKFTHGSIEQPGLFSIQKHISVGIKNKDYYKGKIVILIDETTQSQAEYTTMAYRVAPNATVIGSQTAGADGNVSPLYLPGSVYSLISGIGVYYPDGTETQRIGIVPDIEVKPTIQGIRDHRDEVLESAINLIQENN
ncbi:S41 family peptidase [Chondrinema litorale]|uniref:S41 family peptidase n=1 Tax=Chondrinema litorale TaxID=2994555 RepID=UPI002542A049|nr:S41 family peptidase [Chondrinema litorale]UZR98809.1 S41 family peptidase [Chondrinema litorale]